jgi:hypothetical protein
VGALGERIREAGCHGRIQAQSSSNAVLVAVRACLGSE